MSIDSNLDSADVYEEHRKKQFWPVRVFHGRISRTELLIGSIGLAAIYFIIQTISLGVFNVILAGLLFIVFLSLLARRISDIGLQNSSFIWLGYIFFPLFYCYLLFIPGDVGINADGYPPKPFNGSLKNILALI